MGEGLVDPSGDGAAAIRQRDPWFDEATLIDEATHLEWLIDRGISALDADQVASATTAELRERLVAQIRQRRDAGVAGRDITPEVTRSAILSLSSTPATDVAVVRLTMHVEAAPGTSIGGFDATVDWTLERPAGTLTRQIARSTGCWACGAPISDPSATTCPFCRSALVAAGGWKVARREALGHSPLEPAPLTADQSEDVREAEIISQLPADAARRLHHRLSVRVWVLNTIAVSGLVTAAVLFALAVIHRGETCGTGCTKSGQTSSYAVLALIIGLFFTYAGFVARRQANRVRNRVIETQTPVSPPTGPTPG